MQLSFNYINNISNLVLLTTLEMTRVSGDLRSLPVFIFHNSTVAQEELEVQQIPDRWVKKGMEIHTNVREIGWFL